MNPKIQFNTHELRSFLGKTDFERGQEYYLEKRVKSISHKDQSIYAIVKGSGRNEYRTILYLDREGHLSDCECSCPLESDCKHVGAVGLKTLELWTKKQPEEAWAKTLEKACAPVNQKISGHLQLALQIKQESYGRWSQKQSDLPWTLFLDHVFTMFPKENTPSAP